MLVVCEVKIREQVRTTTTVEGLTPIIMGLMPSKDFFKEELIKNMQELETCPLSSSKALFGGSETFKMKKFETIDPEKFNQFLTVYANELEASYSEEYRFPFTETFHRMIYPLADGTFNKDSESFKRTCKVLKIKHTYKAIKNFLEGN